MRLFDVHLLGVNGQTLHKLLLSLAAFGIIVAVRYAIVGLAHLGNRGHRNERFVFWTRQGVGLVTAVLFTLAVLSIWFSSSQRLGTFAGFIGAGLAFALQKVVTAFAGYLVILRGKTFTVGDRITMGGVRGDVTGDHRQLGRAEPAVPLATAWRTRHQGRDLEEDPRPNSIRRASASRALPTMSSDSRR